MKRRTRSKNTDWAGGLTRIAGNGTAVITRRTVVKGVAVGLCAPAFISGTAFAAPGELNILMWSDYLPPSFIDAFTDETGIRVNYIGIGSNEELISKLSATKGQGFDLVSPTNMRAPQWEPLNLLQPFDLKRVPLDKVRPSMAEIGRKQWAFGGKGVYWLPHIWGTEGIGWRTDKWAPGGPLPSYGDVWSDVNAGKTMGRPHSMMLGAGLYMETIGALAAGSMWDAYKSEDRAKAVWESVTKWCIARVDRIKLFWNDGDSQKNGFLNDGIIVGQTWDGPPIAMKTAGQPVTYRAPKEGAMTWVDGLAMPVGAKNIDQVYAFIEYAYRAEPAGRAITEHGYNSPVLGAEEFAGDAYAKNFKDAYPGDALENLNPWPSEPQWYADIRTGFRDRFVNAA